MTLKEYLIRDCFITYDFTTKNECKEFYGIIHEELNTNFNRSDINHFWTTNKSLKETKNIVKNIENKLSNNKNISQECLKKLNFIIFYGQIIYQTKTN